MTESKRIAMTTERYIQLGVIIISVVAILLANINSYKEINDVKNNYELTIGKIKRYFHIGLPSVRYVEYSYVVNGITYTRTIMDSHYPECEYNLALCDGKKFWVAYSRVNNENSLINLGMEIQNFKPAVAPESLTFFE